MAGGESCPDFWRRGLYSRDSPLTAVFAEVGVKTSALISLLRFNLSAAGQIAVSR